VLDLLQNDKKVKAGKVRFILPEAIGKVIISDRVSPEVIREAIAACQK
jgi:3-dehydroquinate synthase